MPMGLSSGTFLLTEEEAKAILNPKSKKKPPLKARIKRIWAGVKAHFRQTKSGKITHVRKHRRRLR